MIIVMRIITGGGEGQVQREQKLGQERQLSEESNLFRADRLAGHVLPAPHYCTRMAVLLVTERFVFRGGTIARQRYLFIAGYVYTRGKVDRVK